MSDYQTRRLRASAYLSGGFEAILVTDLVNVRYLTGFTGSNGAVLLVRDRPAVIATDGRYLTQVAKQVPDLRCIDARAVAPALVSYAAGAGVRQLAIEATHVTLAVRGSLQDAAGGELEIGEADGVVERLRVVKDDDEIAALSAACAITDHAFDDVVNALRPGLTERDVAWSLRSAIRDHGGDGLAFDSIVAFGDNSAIPHHEPTDRSLATGDLVKLDFGALSAGYHADMTRTVVMGAAADWQRDLHAVVREVQRNARAAVRIGVLPGELNELARAGIEASGHDVAHGLGHGVGLAIHELPFLTAQPTPDRLEDRVPVTIEPGVYLAGRGGVRIEDTVVVGADGATSLTTSSRDLLEIV